MTKRAKNKELVDKSIIEAGKKAGYTLGLISTAISKGATAEQIKKIMEENGFK